MLLNSYIRPKEPKKCCQVREVSDNELNERKQQPTQSVGYNTDIKFRKKLPNELDIQYLSQ